MNLFDADPENIALSEAALKAAQDFYYFTRTLQLVTNLNQDVKELTLLLKMYQGDEETDEEDVPPSSSKKDLN